MTRDDAEHFLSAVEAIMYYRAELRTHPNDTPRNQKLCEEMHEARELAITLLENI